MLWNINKGPWTLAKGKLITCGVMVGSLEGMFEITADA